ncbi:L-threonine 3-dehydrogenase, partial [Micrococcus endophyticus]
RSMGADAAIDVSATRIREAQRELGLAEGFDVGLEMSGRASALQEMVANMNHGGKIALLGLPAEEIAIDWQSVVTHMLTIKGIYGREMFETWYAMAAMLQTNATLRERVESVVTDVIAAPEWKRGFDAARAGATGKIVLDWRNL